MSVTRAGGPDSVLTAVRTESTLRRLQTNNAVITLSQIYTKAPDWGIVAQGTNPCRHVELYRQRKRERFLTESEFWRLGRVLDETLENGGATRPLGLSWKNGTMNTGCIGTNYAWSYP